MKISKRLALSALSCIVLGVVIPICTDEKIGTIEDVVISKAAETSPEKLYEDFVFNVSKSVGLLIKNSVHILQKLLNVQNESFTTILAQIDQFGELVVHLDSFMRDLKAIEPALKRLSVRSKCLRLTVEQRGKALYEGEPICKKLGCIDTASCVTAYLQDLCTVLKPILRQSFVGVAISGKHVDGILVTALDVVGLPIAREVKDMTAVARDIVSVFEDLSTSLTDSSIRMSLKDAIEQDPSGELRASPVGKSVSPSSELQKKAEEVGTIAWQIRQRIPQAELSDLYRAATLVTQMIINVANLIVYVGKIDQGGYKTLNDLIACLKSSDSSPQLCKKLGCATQQQCIARIVRQTGNFLSPILHNALGQAKQKDGKPVVSAGLLLNTTLLLELVLERTYIAMKSMLGKRAAPDSAFDNLKNILDELSSFNKVATRYTYYLDQALAALPLIAVMLYPKLLEQITLSDEDRKVFEQHRALDITDAARFTFADDSLVA